MLVFCLFLATVWAASYLQWRQHLLCTGRVEFSCVMLCDVQRPPREAWFRRARLDYSHGQRYLWKSWVICNAGVAKHLGPAGMGEIFEFLYCFQVPQVASTYVVHFVYHISLLFGHFACPCLWFAWHHSPYKSLFQCWVNREMHKWVIDLHWFRESYILECLHTFGDNDFHNIMSFTALVFSCRYVVRGKRKLELTLTVYWISGLFWIFILCAFAGRVRGDFRQALPHRGFQLILQHVILLCVVLLFLFGQSIQFGSASIYLECVSICDPWQLLHVCDLDLEGLSKVPLVSGIAKELQNVFPEEPALAIERSIAEGLAQSLADEGIDIHEVLCTRDYSRLCPEGDSVVDYDNEIFEFSAKLLCLCIAEDGQTVGMAASVWLRGAIKVSPQIWQPIQVSMYAFHLHCARQVPTDHGLWLEALLICNRMVCDCELLIGSSEGGLTPQKKRQQAARLAMRIYSFLDNLPFLSFEVRCIISLCRHVCVDPHQLSLHLSVSVNVIRHLHSWLF